MTALEMDPQIRARWVAALRSGKYEQGREYLHRDGKLCCLGVLCELAAADGVIPPPRPGVDRIWLYGEAGGMLPAAVMAWAGLTSNDPEIRGICLSARNDGVSPEAAAQTEGDVEPLRAAEPHTFAQIADLIEGTRAEAAA